MKQNKMNIGEATGGYLAIRLVDIALCLFVSAESFRIAKMSR